MKTSKLQKENILPDSTAVMLRCIGKNVLSDSPAAILKDSNLLVFYQIRLQTCLKMHFENILLNSMPIKNSNRNNEADFSIRLSCCSFQSSKLKMSLSHRYLEMCRLRWFIRFGY